MKKVFTIFLMMLAGGSSIAQPFNNYLDLDGIDDYLEDDFTGTNMPNGDFTVEFWLHSCTGTTTGVLIDAAGATVGSGFEMTYNHSVNIISAIVRSSSTAGGNVTYNSISTNTWHHIAIVNNATSMELIIFIDGIPVDTSVVTGYAPSNRFFIGRRDYTSGGFLKVNIDELRISDNIRYNSSFTPSTGEFTTDGNTKALYHFNETTGQVNILDATSNGYDLLAIGGASTITTTSIDVQTACGSYTWIDGNTYSSSTNSPTFTNGCDSLVTLNLTINTVDVTITTTAPSITANAIGATYRWLDCNNGNAIISGETAQTFTAIANGNYAVEVTQNNCTDTSGCVNITSVGVNEVNLYNNIVVHPNPTNRKITIELGDWKGVHISIVNITGKEIYSQHNINETEVELDLSEHSKGIYFLRLQSDNKRKVTKLIKQ
ncbi:MAG: T9SS type A sorting domain-containing protein [Flavobacteriales bacterium]|nr:T9SS type A sorting domain-containing protein [Flavobacteriales bacterium]